MTFGVIGAGGIARKHLDAISAVGGARVTAVVDLDADRARWLTEATSAEFVSRPELLIGRVDAVLILTPPRARLDPVRTLVDAGMPIFCEKPLAATVADAELLAEIVESGPGAPFMMGFMRRWHPPHSAVRAVIESGALGEVVQVLRQRIGRIDLPQGNWRSSPGQLCGITMESASHDFDLLRWLFGDIARAAGEVVESRPELPGFDESMAATLRFETGLSGALQVSWQSRLARNSLTVVGTEGSLALDGPGMWSSRTLTVVTAEGETVREFSESDAIDDGYTGQMAAFLALVRGEHVEHPGVRDGLATVRLSQSVLDHSAAAE
ncbi:MAG: Gfo/Idh/MocA family oxidoreductase [Microcella sp.]|uniref:Gfo/Idh/MocA family protein n=1 Tax=Microcella sp. TaxID=1913979 RepID=UPI0024C84A2D|nr:Gfo/Idh/MocA family oxidoreductase [Microcella sp.]UYN83457.1 MAG: Gfo/Idh/MocA family oxidoreductase [Microcella sp.]